MESFSSDDGRDDIVAFQNYALAQSTDLYTMLARPDSPEQLILKYDSLRVHWGHIDWLAVDSYIPTLMASKEYRTIHRQTQRYLAFCNAQWEGNYAQTSTIIPELTGLELHEEFTIYITHPGQRNGANFDDNKIGWGHHEDWPNHTTVYLWYGILHSYLGNGDLEHAVIQLIADEELRVRLNEGSYPPFVGHEYLVPILEKILPKMERLNTAGPEEHLPVHQRPKTKRPPRISLTSTLWPPPL